MMVNMLFTFCPPATLQDWAETLNGHVPTVNMLSFFVSGFTALMLGLAYRRVRSEKWIKYFAFTFLLLAVQYLYRVLVGFITPNQSHSLPSSIFLDIVSPLVALFLSIGTNLLSLAAARDISLGTAKPKRKKEPLIPWGYR